ncbi:MAG: cytoplasmic protein [Desulfobacterales bacterium]|nr:cytoplasmic protein [Desulfobacterales bacterium]
MEFVIDKKNLYREESITDLKVGSIRLLKPIKLDGSDDSGREDIFIGHTQIMTPQGMIPLQARLTSKTLEKALGEFPNAMQQALERMIEEVKKMQQEEANQPKKDDSRIIVPGR